MEQSTPRPANQHEKHQGNQFSQDEITSDISDNPEEKGPLESQKTGETSRKEPEQIEEEKTEALKDDGKQPEHTTDELNTDSKGPDLEVDDDNSTLDIKVPVEPAPDKNVHSEEETVKEEVDEVEAAKEEVDEVEAAKEEVDEVEAVTEEVGEVEAVNEEVDASEAVNEEVDASEAVHEETYEGGDEEGGSDEDEIDDDGEEVFDKYNKLTKEELVDVLEALVKEEDINQIRLHIGYIKASFRKLIKDESLNDYEKRIHKDSDHDESGEEVVDELVQRYEQALSVYREKKIVYDHAIEQQKQENLTIKEKILEELRSLIESEEELKKTYDQFRDLQDQWRLIGAVPQSSKNTLWNNYHFLVEKFFDKVKINKELKDLDLKKNLEAKTELCEKAEELLLETSITKSFQQLQKLHEAWKETGPVPKDKKDEIWERFKAATEKLNKRRQDYYDNLREEQNNNYSAKLILCEKAEQLTVVTPESPKQWQNYTNQINELFKMWKTIGFAPKKVNNEVWNRFRSSLDTFYRNKKEFFRKYKEHQTENYNQKLNLCLQAEALKDNEDWRNTTEDLIALQKQWKKIGPVPAKFSDKIWKRFRAACDEFFHNKADHFSSIGEKQDENLKMKLDLIEKVKNYPYADDNNANLKVLKDYQREWMEIGHVPIKQKDKVQASFRKVIDEQFDRLNISKKAKNTLSFRNKVDNIKNAPNAENLIYKERNFIINKITTIQSDIKIWENNIGFFASSKKADILKAEFEEKIDTGRQEIQILEEKLKILRES